MLGILFVGSGFGASPLPNKLDQDSLSVSGMNKERFFIFGCQPNFLVDYSDTISLELV